MAIDPAILSKIQKLLSLGTNNSEKAEAESALRKAAEMAEAHGLSLSDINPVTQKFDNLGKNTLVMAEKHHDSWMLPLASFVGVCFECNTVISPSEGKMYFIGTKTDIELTSWYFKLIRIKILMAAKSKFKNRKDQATFGYGAYQELRKRLHDMFVKPREDARSAETRALVVCKKESVEEKTKEFFPQMKKKSAPIPNGNNLDALLKGKELGQTMNLHRGEIKNNHSNKMIA